jgi:hypothetical protein
MPDWLTVRLIRHNMKSDRRKTKIPFSHVWFFTFLANVRNPDVAGVHNENDLNMLTRDC